MSPKTLWIGFLTLAFALAGCSDADESDDTNIPGSDPTPTPSPTGGTDNSTDPEEEPSEDLVISGTVTGVADCTLATTDAGPQMSSTESLPEGAAGGDYSLSVEGDEAGTATVCVSWGDGGFSSSDSGMVPEEATALEIAADGAPMGVSYTIVITPAA